MFDRIVEGVESMMRLYPDEGLGIVMFANGTNLEDHAIADAIALID